MSPPYLGPPLGVGVASTEGVAVGRGVEVGRIVALGTAVGAGAWVAAAGGGAWSGCAAAWGTGVAVAAVPQATIKDSNNTSARGNIFPTLGDRFLCFIMAKRTPFSKHFGFGQG